MVIFFILKVELFTVKITTIYHYSIKFLLYFKQIRVKKLLFFNLWCILEFLLCSLLSSILNQFLYNKFLIHW